jgi:thiamine biosynthesis lipoprotein ApbE
VRPFFEKLSRRSFVMLPVLAPLGALARERSEEHWFHYDYIIGTSMDLAMWLPATSDSAEIARQAARTTLDEINRLSRILSTYDPHSEVCRFEREPNNRYQGVSRELAHVFELYRYWQKRTEGVLSMRPAGEDAPINVDALGKAYIIDRVAALLKVRTPNLEGLVLNIGGDIVVWGRGCELGVIDPSAAHDNSEPLTRIALENEAVATSGIYARGAHLIDARTGKLPPFPASATVIARDAVTANALATTLCIVDNREGMDLVGRIPGAEAMRIGPAGMIARTPGFARRERVIEIRQSTPSNWPAGFEVTISLTLTTPDPRLDRSYAAFWVEDLSGKLVRAIVLWGNKAQYHPEMSSFWKITRGDKDLLYKLTRATRAPGSYRVVWNGLDDDGKPVPRGTYRVVVETNRYRGDYAKASGTIACESEPTTITLAGSVNYDTIKIQYGPRPSQV